MQALIIRDGQVLVVIKRYPDGVAYILPGGRQEHGESLEAAVLRECREELGVEVAVGPLLFVREYIGKNHQYATRDSELHLVNILFHCRVPDDYLPRSGVLPDPEQIGVTWLPIERLHDVRFFPAALKEALLAPERTPVYLGDIN